MNKMYLYLPLSPGPVGILNFAIVGETKIWPSKKSHSIGNINVLFLMFKMSVEGSNKNE